ncbi:hypothetical protein VTI28DRAFT_7093 [Corynascus sepedonium]
MYTCAVHTVVGEAGKGKIGLGDWTCLSLLIKLKAFVATRSVPCPYTSVQLSWCLRLGDGFPTRTRVAWFLGDSNHPGQLTNSKLPRLASGSKYWLNMVRKGVGFLV